MAIHSLLHLYSLLRQTNPDLIKAIVSGKKDNLPDIARKPTDSTIDVEVTLSEITQIAPSSGFQLMAAIAHRIINMTDPLCMDLLKVRLDSDLPFTQYANPVNQVMWFFLYENEHFLEVEDIRHSMELCSGGHSQSYDTPRTIHLPNNPPLEHLKTLLAKSFGEQESHFHVRHFSCTEYNKGMPEKVHHFVIYKEGDHRLFEELQKQGQELVSSICQPVGVYVIDYRPQQQKFEVLAQGEVEQNILAKVFARGVLNLSSDESPIAHLSTPTPLVWLRQRRDFNWEATDNIKNVAIKKIVLFNTQTTGEMILSTGRQNTNDVYDELLSQTGSPWVRDHCEIKEATFEVLFKTGYPRKFTFTVRSDGTHSLRAITKRHSRVLELMNSWITQQQSTALPEELIVSETLA